MRLIWRIKPPSCFIQKDINSSAQNIPQHLCISLKKNNTGDAMKYYISFEHLSVDEVLWWEKPESLMRRDSCTVSYITQPTLPPYCMAATCFSFHTYCVMDAENIGMYIFGHVCKEWKVCIWCTTNLWQSCWLKSEYRCYWWLTGR